jgi:hypothetical protein
LLDLYSFHEDLGFYMEKKDSGRGGRGLPILDFRFEISD